MKRGLNEMAKDIHELAVIKGWWDGGEGKSLPEILMLCVSELSEALEEYRDGKPTLYYYCKSHDTRLNCPDKYDGCQHGKNAGCSNRKPQGIAAELADCIIRILDYCAWVGIDIEEVIATKHEHNKSRPYRHGGKVC